MHRDMRVAAVLPAFNEERYIAATVKLLQDTAVDDVIVVDDASTDRTRDEALNAGADHVVTHPENRGVGGALITGFKAAVERGNDVAVVIPGDGQADLEALPRLLDKSAQGFGLVISDRISGRDPREYGMPAYRLWGSRALSVLTWVATGTWVPDPQSGYKAVTRETLQRVPLDTLYPRWGFHNDMISYCSLLRIPIASVPARPVYEDASGAHIASHIKLWDLVPRHLKLFARMLVRRIRWTLGVGRA